MSDLKEFVSDLLQIMSRSLNKVLVSDIIVETKPAASAKAATLEAHHQLKMREFEAEKEELGRLRVELADTEMRLEAVGADTDEGRTLSDTVTALQNQISAIESDDRRLDYFLDVGDMLFQYYEAQESLARGDIRPAARAPKRMPVNSVMSYFAAAAPAPAVAAAAAAKPKEKTVLKASVVDFADGLNRDKMLEKYLAIVEPEAIKTGILPGSGIEPGWGRCSVCEEEMLFYQNEAKLSCPACGQEEMILVDSEKPSYKDPPREITYFAYKKQNHFNEWLAQFQAKENTDIPQDVIEAVLNELRKERISDPKRVKKEKILEILRKLKLSKMYDHVQQIKNRIQQQMTSLTLSKEVEEKLQHMFKEIQPAFIKYCPKGRSNFLSYPYVLYKMCQLLEMDEFLPCFQLLKSREKLYQQDQVWQKICEELGWQFIRSI
jgi:hypothetical protein